MILTVLFVEGGRQRKDRNPDCERNKYLTQVVKAPRHEHRLGLSESPPGHITNSTGDRGRATLFNGRRPLRTC